MEIDGLAGVTSPLLHVFDQLRDDGLVRRDRVLGAGDGAPDDDVARAALDGLGGVATRVWSPSSAPAGRTPGVTMSASGPSSSRMA